MGKARWNFSAADAQIRVPLTDAKPAGREGDGGAWGPMPHAVMCHSSICPGPSPIP